MARLAILEAFDTPATSATEAGPSEEWQAGFAAGRDAALSEIEGHRERQIEALVQSLEDRGFGFAEARADLLRRLDPLFTLLFTRLLPDLVPPILVAHLVAVIRHSTVADMERPLRLTVHPDMVPALGAALASSAGLAAVIETDPQLRPGAAIIQDSTGETSLDPSTFLEEARQILAAVFQTASHPASPTTERKAHG